MYNNIPQVLRDMDIWLCYDSRDKESYKQLSNREIEDNKKKPRDLTGKPHSINGKLFNFNECIDSIRKGFNNGLGLVLNNNSGGLVVIDYDKVLKGIEVNDKLGYIKPIFKDAETEQRVLRDINLFKSYTEISPSNTGIHIYLIANTTINTNKQHHKDKNKQIEVYSSKKFIRVSETQVFYEDIEDNTDNMEQFIKWYDLDKQDAEIKTGVINTRFNIYKSMLDKWFLYDNSFTDADILKTMFNSKKGKLIKKLYEDHITDNEFIELKQASLKAQKKDASDIDTSNSGKAFTLIMYLLHFCYGDLIAVKRIFIKSALCKDDYLSIKYGYNNKKQRYTKDKIDYCFIPRAIYYYKNYDL